MIKPTTFEELSNLFKSENGSYRNEFPKEVLDLIYREKLFKLFLPEDLGGLNLKMPETLDVLQKAAYINGSLGWLVQIGNGGNYFASLFDEEVTKRFFGPEKAVLAGSGAPSGIATVRKGGFEISGKWRFSSGSDYASFFTAVAKIEGTDETITFALLRSQVSVIDDWKTSGLKNTSTNSFEVKKAFVPLHHTFYYTKKRFAIGNEVFQFPFLAFAQLFFMKMIFGMFERFVKETVLLSSEQEVKWKITTPGRADQLRSFAASALQELSSFNEQLDHYVETIPSMTDAEKESAALLLDKEAKKMNHALRDRMHTLFAMCGMNVLYSEHPVNVFYMDLTCVMQHALLNNYSSSSQ